MDAAPVSNAATRSQEVYERLRGAIVRGELRPNERLVEAELAGRLQVSRTPVRECLQRLASEGLIANRRRGWCVLEHTDADIHEIYEVRAALEGYAARLAAERATPLQVSAISESTRKEPRSYAGRPVGELVGLNEAFHDAVIAAAGNRRLATATRQTREYYFNFRLAAMYSDAEVIAAFADHQRIARAIRVRDADAAEALARAHVAEALKIVSGKLT